MNAEQQYIDLYNNHKVLLNDHSTPVMNAFREQAFADFKRLGFPTTSNENYQNTDVIEAFTPDYGLNLQRLSLRVNPNTFQCSVSDLGTLPYYVINDSYRRKTPFSEDLPKGVFIGEMNEFETLNPQIASKYYGKIASTSDNGVVALNTLLAQEALVIYLPKNTRLEAPIQLINMLRFRVDMMVNRRVLIILEEYSALQLLICDHSIGNVNFLINQVVEIFVEEGATCEYYDLEESSTTTIRFSSVSVKQEASSNVLINGMTLNNGTSRNDYNITLNGERAEAELYGIAILDGTQHVDTSSHIVHAVPNCTSDELVKNVLNDQSVGAFCGRIYVAKDAQKTIAYQTNRNLCMTDEARIFSKPQLEIYADDVKCSHGMTTGQLDDQALFYMQSRGISLEEARMMLGVAFTSDVIDHIKLEPLKERLRELVERRFRGELIRCRSCKIECPN